MPRSRMIKPEFWDDEKLSTVSRDARLTFVGLWTYADDYGVVKGNALWLKNHIFSYDDIKVNQFEGWLKELEKIGCISPFTADNEKFYYISHFLKHQTINHPSKRLYPEPPQEITNTLPEDSRSTPVVLPFETKTETETETETETYTRARKPRNTLPTLEDVKTYCRERKNLIDPEKWFDHYTSNGWKVGKNPMKDWKAAVRTWEKSNGNATGPPSAPRTKEKWEQILDGEITTW